MIDHQTVDPVELVALLKEKQQSEGLSLGQLERGTGVARQSLRLYLDGSKQPSQLQTRKKIADYLNGGRMPALPELSPEHVDQLKENLKLSPDQRLRLMESDHWRTKYYTLLEVVRDLLLK